MIPLCLKSKPTNSSDIYAIKTTSDCIETRRVDYLIRFMFLFTCKNTLRSNLEDRSFIQIDKVDVARLYVS